MERLGLPVCELQCEVAVSTPTSGLVVTSSLCARCPVESKSNLPTSTRVEGNFGDGLALYQSCSYRMLREEAVISRLRGA